MRLPFSLLLTGGLLVAVAAAVAFRFSRTSESTPALRGRAAATELGCFGCHGADGLGGVPDPGSRSGTIPGWDGMTVATFALDEAEIREWILDGRPARLKHVDTEAGRKPLVPMPAYRGRISAAQLEDCLAYFRAVSGFVPSVPEAAYEGRKVAERFGCFSCHGPAGIGGCPNPGSFKGHIPAWDGDELPELVRDEAELREWILDGKIRRLWDNPAARHFLEGQLIQMPAYRRHLSDTELAQLVAYVQWLRKADAKRSGGAEDHHVIGWLGLP